ncbi:MAG: deoxyribodipyrimidine photo-lyase, partial [Leptolyngbya sp. SIO1D8]|nr:deoxyribodipyrimidine photo-lyase [Leptolyngbya sp. SIO1D8]
CPIDHYQWAMQSGVTHCLDKPWTRIYNPGQVAVDRCDPDGAFIKQWVPEVAHLAPESLGNPPAVKGYPTPILDYRQARQQHIQKLEKQREYFLNSDNIVPYLAPMPEDMTPFGADRYPSNITWVQASAETMFPPALDLASLDIAQARALRTWFVAHVNIPPPKIRKHRLQSPVEQLGLNLSV